MNKDAIKPLSLQVDATGLKITWPQTGLRTYAPSLLRQACPCAQCVSEVTGALLLNRKAVPLDLTLMSAEPMGHYGVALGFSDQHFTGIYTFDYLWRMPEAFDESPLSTTDSTRPSAQNSKSCHSGECGCS